MTINALYSELNSLLGEQRTALVVSQYNPDGSIIRNLMGEVEQKTTPFPVFPGKTTVSGPLVCITNEDGSLTLIERFMPKPRLIILGGGHLSLALAEIAYLTGFDTIVYDDRPSFANAQRFSRAKAVICDSFTRLDQHLTLGVSDFVAVVTRGHRHDKECLEVILRDREPVYAGMVGSQRRVAIVFSQLEGGGFDKERISRIHAPIGLKIGAQTPAEIAISIMAQIIEVKRLGQGEAPWLSCDLELVDRVARNGFDPQAVVTVLETRGSVPTEVGCKLGMTYAGSIAGSVGGGCSEAEAMLAGREIITKGGWKLLDIDLTDSAEDEGMVCGGTMQVLIERA